MGRNYLGILRNVLERYQGWHVCIVQIRLLRGQNKSRTKNKSSKVPFKGRITNGTGGLETDSSRRLQVPVAVFLITTVMHQY